MIQIRDFGSGTRMRSYIVYWKGIRISPGEVQEDGFRSRGRAQRFANAFVALRKKYDEPISPAGGNKEG